MMGGLRASTTTLQPSGGRMQEAMLAGTHDDGLVSKLFLTDLGREFRDELELYSSDMVSQTTVLLQKRRQMDQVEAMLKQKRKEFARRNKKCDKWENLLMQKQVKLQETIGQFERFVRENDLKRARAQEREVGLRQELERRENELDNLTMELQRLRLQREENVHLTQRLSKYRDFLDEVLQSSGGDYEAPEALMAQHEMLVTTKASLLEEKAKGEARFEEARARMNAWEAQQSSLLVTLVKDLAELQQKLDVLSGQNQTEGHRDAQRHQAKIYQTSENLQVRIAIHNIFERCRGRNITSHGWDQNQILSYVNDRMSDLQHIAAHRQQIIERQFVGKEKRRRRRRRADDETGRARTSVHGGDDGGDGQAGRRQGSVLTDDIGAGPSVTQIRTGDKGPTLRQALHAFHHVEQRDQGPRGSVVRMSATGSDGSGSAGQSQHGSRRASGEQARPSWLMPAPEGPPPPAPPSTAVGTREGQAAGAPRDAGAPGGVLAESHSAAQLAESSPSGHVRDERRTQSAVMDGASGAEGDGGARASVGEFETTPGD
ncbi:unnamed protein product [Pedinophyceae sp. YPF-701]|nr:unnamed protein product [Pedinophyceae sp. YPF-701]